jgi:hypothetical protein
MDHHSQISPGDFYTDTVLPALADQLDQAFPEFGWRRDNRGWVATNQETTHRLLGVRADRVVAHGHAPQGFLVHGAQPVLWTAYVNDGTIPRGTEFIRVVRQIAQRAGVDTTPLERPVPRDRRAELLNDFFELCRQELAGPNGADSSATQSNAQASASFPNQHERATLSKQPATRNPRSHARTCLSTPAGPAASAAPGTTTQAEREPSGRAP